MPASRPAARALTQGTVGYRSKLRRRQLTEDVNVEISGRELGRAPDDGRADRPGASQFDPMRSLVPVHRSGCCCQIVAIPEPVTESERAAGSLLDGGAKGCSGAARTIIEGLFVEPDVFPSKPAEDAIDHHGLALDVGPHTGVEAGVKDDRPRLVLGQFALYLPQYLLPAPRVAFRR